MRVTGWGTWTHWLVAIGLCLFALSFCAPSEAQEQVWVNRAYGFTNTTLPGYDNETNPNRTGIVSVSLDLNTASFFLSNPLPPYFILLGRSNHYCWQFADGSFRRREFNYVGPSYIVDILLNEDNSLWVYLDDVLLDPVELFCAPVPG